MTVEQITDIVGSLLNRHFISRRKWKENTGPFKGVKTYEITLNEISLTRDIVDPIEIFKVSDTATVNSLTEQGLKDNTELQYTRKLMKYAMEQYTK